MTSVAALRYGEYAGDSATLSLGPATNQFFRLRQ
jgi:hypothetical protein